MDQKPQGASPGLLYVGSKVIKPDLISQDDDVKWYGDSHVPDVLKTSGVEEAYIWQAQDPTFEHPVLVFYPLKDTGFLNTAEMGSIPTHYDDLPGSGKILFAPENAKPGQSDFLVVAAMTPADDQDFRQPLPPRTPLRLRHRSRLATKRALRTSRSVHDGGSDECTGAAEVFDLGHYIDGETFPAAEMAKLGESEWTKKIIVGAEKVGDGRVGEGVLS
ncbi:hypothetical protein TI39_contig393g00007 [Zymoseptoria brevis]|uniref:Uncharacterized protein n=1 Tax=Zymoseptoria brevis TaxID=1047168 RepID=A0A0F4GNV3_9PEZI|nr:hypothetical protein TI39_contig393g00007 [Zymoseptoria brevis]